MIPDNKQKVDELCEEITDQNETVVSHNKIIMGRFNRQVGNQMMIESCRNFEKYNKK